MLKVKVKEISKKVVSTHFFPFLQLVCLGSCLDCRLVWLNTGSAKYIVNQSRNYFTSSKLFHFFLKIISLLTKLFQSSSKLFVSPGVPEELEKWLCRCSLGQFLVWTSSSGAVLTNTHLHHELSSPGHASLSYQSVHWLLLLLGLLDLNQPIRD